MRSNVHARRFDANAAERVRALIATRQDTVDGATGPEVLAGQLRAAFEGYATLRMHYQAGIEEVLTKANILRQEFEQIRDYSPIGHVHSQLNSPERLLEKAVRTSDTLTMPAIRAASSPVGRTPQS